MTNEDIRPVRIGKFLLPAILALAIPFTLTALAQVKNEDQSQIVVFLAPIAHPVSTYALFTVVADLNRDGRQDVVIAHTNGKVGVMLGNGDGTLQAETTYATGTTFTASVAVADVNRDGKPDIVASNWGGEANGDASVVVLIGNGDGTFQRAVAYDSGFPYDAQLAVADVDGDGKPDIVVLNANGNGIGDVGVLLGNGDGTFQRAAPYDSGGQQPCSLAIGDLNGDGSQDLVVTAFRSNSVSVLMGNGHGAFQSPVVYSASYPCSSAVADLNGDGKLDVVVTNYTSNTVGVLFGNGDGTLQPIVTFSSGGVFPGQVVVGDVNKDGRPDLVVGNCGNPCGTDSVSDVAVLVGKGDGSFQPPVTFLSGTRWLTSLAVADMDGDGWPDIVTVSNSTSRVTLGGGANTCNSGGCGTVFKITPSGKETVLYNFTGGSDGQNPDVIVGPYKGNLYGLSRTQDNAGAAIFEINAAGDFSIAYNGDAPGSRISSCPSTDAEVRETLPSVRVPVRPMTFRRSKQLPPATRTAPLTELPD